jgi:uncharacterized protein YgiM (DUF1202 family)
MMKHKPGRVGRATREYDSPCGDPVVVRAGEMVSIADRKTDWEGWIWCTTREGQSRWVPESFVERSGEAGTMLRDYEATELSVHVGEQLLLGEEVAGWVWCTSRNGRSGWVPSDSVAE